MATSWHEKKNKQADLDFERNLQNREDSEISNKALVGDAAMGGGEALIFEKKLSKEAKKAAAKAKREAKKKAKQGSDEEEEELMAKKSAAEVLQATKEALSSDTRLGIDDGLDHEQAEELAAAGTICTYAASRKGIDARSRDINVQNVTMQHMGAVLLDHTEIVLNHGNRYGLIGRNGCGKSTLLKALGARALPVPSSIDIFFLKEEVEPSATMTAIEAVMSVDEERLKLEVQAEELNTMLGLVAENPDLMHKDDAADSKTPEEVTEEIMEALNNVYERLDLLDAATAEVRARSILSGLGFTHEMQGKFTKDFSGGWRMRVSLARALFIRPMCLLLDEPTNHLDMEAVIWLEDYLSKWNRILLLVSHSQDFLNNVCTHTIHFNNKQRLLYYDGNYDQFCKTKSEREENQWKQYKWEQEQMKSMKDFIARFGHGTSKNAKQAQSREKVLAKMVNAGLTEKPEEEKPMNFNFRDPGHLPPPVLAFHDVKFGYPGCEPLYTNVNFGVDLDSRVALVGPNGAGKTTLVKLMSGELNPTLGDIRPHGHLKLGRFTQHFVDVLDLSQTPLEFFEKMYPTDTYDEQRKYLGRFGVSGKMQMRKMEELSDGQKSRVVLAKLGRDVPHILLLDEPTNHLDMEGIDALAKAVNEYQGGLVLVSHDMRLISQVAKEIWICDNKTITTYKGDIMNFKLDMQKQMGLEGDQETVKLKGDASVKKSTEKPKPKAPPKPEPPKLTVIRPVIATIVEEKPEPAPVPAPAPAPTPEPVKEPADDATVNTVSTAATASTGGSTAATAPSTAATATDAGGAAPKSRYIPPHLRKKMAP